jgi:hypothetical protein
MRVPALPAAAAALAFATLAPPALAQAPAPEHTLETFQALPEAERTAYVAGLADALDLAAAMPGASERLRAVAGCTNGFDAAALRGAVEAGPEGMAVKWDASAPAAGWFVATMILVCQLQLPPE